MIRAKHSDVQSIHSNDEVNNDNSNRDIVVEHLEHGCCSDNNDMTNTSGDMQPIAREFRQHYKRKLLEICEEDSQDCIQAKMKLQEDWIRDLSEQNEMLIKAVIDLESEATKRVKMLEEKLKQSAECACEAQDAAALKDRQIEQLQGHLTGRATNRFEDTDQFRLMQDNYSMLKQTMQDVRDALTAEVADKHDAIVALRRDVQLLEEQCKRADQQTHFKDDIIKELRKDLKQLKHEGTCTADCPAQFRVTVLEEENKNLKAAIKQAQMELEQLENKTENYLDGDDENFNRPLKDMNVDIIPAVSLVEAQFDMQQMHDQHLQSIFIGSKPQSDSKSSKRSSTFELADVINNLSESVSQMMMRNATNKSRNRRIQDLEYQLAEAMKSKDVDIDEERNRRSVEINNLIRTIQEQEDTLHTLQYQSKNLTECMNVKALKGTIKELKEEHNQMNQVIEYQKVELRNCSQELIRLQDILQSDQPMEQFDTTSIETRLKDALMTNESLMAEISILKSKLSSESKTGQIYEDRINELQSMIYDKGVETERWHTTAVDFKRQLDQAGQKQAELEHNINSMQRNMAKSDIVSVIQNEETNACREEVDVCLGELRQLKGKINLEASVYAQKMETLESLKSRCALQNGTIDVLRRDLKDERIRHKDEVLNLKQQIREIKDRDTTLDIDNRQHLERIKHMEDQLKVLSDHEQQLINHADMRESELTERVTKSRSEEIRLVSEITQLEQRAAELDAEVQRLRSELENVRTICADRQGEMGSMKTEVNLLLQRQGKIKAENSKLRAHINNLQRTKRNAHGDSDKLMEQLDNCLRQLEQLHGEKDFLAIQNEQLQQCVCTRESELIQAQEQLDEIRTNRDEVCEESRTVVTNVRQWLHHQHAISEKVKEKVRKLERDNRDLQRTMDEMSIGTILTIPHRMRGGSPVRSRSSNLIYPCNCNLNSRGGTQSPASTMSGESGPSADDSSVNYSSGSENELDNMKLGKQMSTPEVWLHKVENMTAELQRSNVYWKRKLYKNKSMHDEKQ